MYTITQAVKEILSKDFEATKSLERGILNYSQYANEMKVEIERLTFKPVNVRSIVTALVRLSKSEGTKRVKKYVPDSVTIHDGLVEIAFHNSSDPSMILEIFNKLHGFKTFTQGITETSIIINHAVEGNVVSLIDEKDIIFKKRGLTGITLKLDLEHLEAFGVFQEIVGRLAVRDIVIYEIISTPTEVTLIISSDFKQHAIGVLT